MMEGVMGWPWRRRLASAGGIKAAAGAAVALALAVALWRLDWPLYRRLHEQGTPADGWVEAKDLHGGRTVEYAYTVGARTFTGTGTAGYGNPEFQDLSPGDRVLVFYLARDPSVSALGDPELRLRQQNRIIFISLLVAAAALAAVLGRELAKASG